MDEYPRICIFTETYHPVVGGGETQARLLAEGLRRLGIAVTILTRRTDLTLAKVENYEGILIYRLPPVGRHHLNKWGLLFSGLLALYRLRQTYDVILVSGFRVIGVAAVLISKIAAKICLLKADNNGEMSGEFFRGGLEKLGSSRNFLPYRMLLRARNGILKRADGFIAISTQISDEFVRHGIPPGSKISCLPNSVDTQIFKPVSPGEKRALRKELGFPESDALVIFTGRLVVYKGLLTLLKTWERIQEEHRNVRLILVGGASLDIYSCETELKEFVSSRDLGESVFFCGEVTDVHRYLQAADIFVFPTEKEAFGISLIEAMSCGLPVISTNVGGLQDIVRDGENGLVIRPGNEADLFSALNRLLNDQELGEKLCNSALKTVKERFSSQIVTENYLDLFLQSQEKRRTFR
jgi:glycosyltransferase involved in cell wall biosynthesis